VARAVAFPRQSVPELAGWIEIPQAELGVEVVAPARTKQQQISRSIEGGVLPQDTSQSPGGGGQQAEWASRTRRRSTPIAPGRTKQQQPADQPQQHVHERHGLISRTSTCMNGF
jgi:hypothetical protein